MKKTGGYMDKHKIVFKCWWGWKPEIKERRIDCRIDYQDRPGFDNQCLQLFEDAGWTLCAGGIIHD